MFRLNRHARHLALLLVVQAATDATAVDLIGYLPNYRMNPAYVRDVLPGQLAMLDEVRYFGLTVDGVGSIVPLSGSYQDQLGNLATLQGVIDSLPAADRPRLNITLGGAGQDATFTSVAADAGKRGVLAQNVESLLDQTGAASVDINWEHPDAGIQRTSQYPALLKRIKQEIGEERRVYATVAPSVVISNSVFSGPDAIDGASIMTYDLGWWSNDPTNPNNGEHSLQEYAVDTVAAWTEPPGSRNDRPWVFGAWGNDSPADRLGVALPFYGRSLPSQTAYTYGELVAGGVTTDGEYYQYRGQQVWAPSPELVAERVEFAAENDLQHVIIWEIGQDLPTDNEASLLRSAFEAREALASIPGDFNRDGTVDGADYTVWRDGLGEAFAQADYDVWAANFGATTPAPSRSVPEPSTALLWVSLLSVCRSSARHNVPAN